MCIAPKDVSTPDGIYAVSMTQFNYGIESSKEIPWVIEGLHRAAMIIDSWSGSFRTFPDVIYSISLPQTLHQIDQVLAVKPITVPDGRSLALVEIRLDGEGQDTHTFFDFEIMMAFMEVTVQS